MGQDGAGWTTVSQQFLDGVDIETDGRGLRDVTAAIVRRLDARGAGDGLLTVFVRHTSASLTIGENTDPDVGADLLEALDRLAPEDASYRHDLEGPDDMPAHIKAALTQTSLSIPVRGGRLALGTWQGLFLIEHRARPHRRSLVLHFAGSRRNGG